MSQSPALRPRTPVSTIVTVAHRIADEHPAIPSAPPRSSQRVYDRALVGGVLWLPVPMFRQLASRANRSPPPSDQPTSAMLKADINSGRTGDKVGVFDPGLSSSG